MARERRPPPQPPAAEPGLLARLFGRLLTGLFWLWTALVLSVLLEWTGMILWWPEQGVEHSRGMLEAEIGYLNEDFKESLLVSSPARLARRFADGFHRVFFDWTRLADFLQWLSAPPASGEGRFTSGLRALYAKVADFALASLLITQVFAVRLAVLVLALPAFALFGLVGFADGLMRRDLRRWGGGREHGFLYHHAKRPVLPSVVGAWVIYLGLPVSIHPTYVVVPFAALFGGLLALTSATFKKYL
jgi:integrating conjugative element membrane protein (TIGR03747 family)